MHKNIVITGATDGIGLAAAKSIAKKDYNLILVGRNPKKGKKALETIISETGNKNLDFFECDLSLVANVKDLSDKINSLLNDSEMLSQLQQGALKSIATEFSWNNIALQYKKTLNL